MGGVLGISFVALLIIGMPIPFCLGLSSIFALAAGNMDMVLFPQRIIAGTDSFSLLAIPFFILAGEIMDRGGLSKRLIEFANVLVGHITGGLAMTTVIAATFFGAISGSAPATTAAIGSITVPEMEKRGYDRNFAAALASAVGPIGQMIPPSIPMVIWAVMANISISKLFLAGIMPGLLMAISLMAVSYFIAKKKGWKGRSRRATGKELLHAFVDGFWALLSPVIILGGIYGGIFTPTEAAAVSVIYGLLVGVFIYKNIKLPDLYPMFSQAVKMTIVVVFVISTASLFGWITASEQIAQKVVQGLLSVTTSKILIMLIINVLLLIIGCFMDNIAAMVILCSVLSSVAANIGVDPVHFGAIVVINFAVGMCTPPVGYSLFVGSAISDLSIEQVSKAIWPFVLTEIAVLFLITNVPQIVLFIPTVFK